MNPLHPMQPGTLSSLCALVGLVLVLGGSPSQAAVEANRASQAELETVTGIGPNLSARILQARHDQAFRDWEDLLKRVSGLGPANAVKLSRAGLQVAGTPYPKPSSDAASDQAFAGPPKPRDAVAPRR